MITVDVPTADIARLRQALEGAADRLPRELAIVINGVRRAGVSLTSKGIVKELPTTQRAVKKSTIKESTRATPSKLRASIRIVPTDRLLLKEFKPKELKRGISAKVSKNRKPTKILNAFFVDRYARNVYKRRGPARGPLTKLKGPSPWGVFVKQQLLAPVSKEIERRFASETDKRLRAIMIRQKKLAAR